MKAWRLALAGFVLASAVAFGACSSSSSSSPLSPGSVCSSDPPGCPSGTTCWPADSTPTLKCLPSQPGGGFGAACQQSIGQATCAEGLGCDQTGPSDGHCTYYCGSGGRSCPAGYGCYSTHVGNGGPAVDICRPGGLELDGGFASDADYDVPVIYDSLFQIPDGSGTEAAMK